MTPGALAFIALAFTTVQGQAISDSSARALIRQQVDQGTNPAIVVGILEGGHTRVVAYGKPDAPNQKLDGNTVFEIGSITKVFTSTILAEMVRKGEVSLSDPVAKYLPSTVRIPSRNGRSITLVDLAMQQSGLPRQPGNFSPENPNNPWADYTADKMFEFLASYELPRDVGAEFEYSNLGVGLLGEALSRRAGVDYATLVAQRITGPLGMAHTRIALTANQQKRLAQGHDQSGNSAENWDVRGIPGAGALRSTANDMLKFAAAAMSPSGPLGPAFADAEKPRRSLGPAMQIGLNWFTAASGPIEIVFHNGGTGGYRSYLGLDRVHQRAVIVLTNSGNPADAIGRRLLIDAAQRPEVRHYVMRLGRDTMSVERVTRFGDRLEAVVAIRNPVPIVVRISAAHPRGDTITTFTLATRRADAAANAGPVFERLTTIRDTLATTVVKRNGVVDTTMSSKAFRVRPGVQPFTSATVAFYDHALRRARAAQVDSLGYDEYGVGQTPVFSGYVARRGDEMAVDFGGKPLFARVDGQGRISRLDMRATTVKTVTEYKSFVDVEGIARRWAVEKAPGLPSPRDTARAALGETTIAIDYGRPSTRGRAIFGALVPFDTIWRVGANAATQLILNQPIQFGSALIPAGKYSLWMVPSKNGARLIVNRQSGQWGTAYDSTQDFVAIPLEVRPRSPLVEQLTISIVPADDRSGALRIVWADREFVVSLRRP